ncbi:hypothetical protein ACFYZ9_35425 [Streptomyces sp. NPDC001691]|uniref:hypothetical protein n=1 Tax=Streptomyces sp. NPDC001691 TaxID=3364600 RepID=UPI0036CE1DFC
MSGRGAGGVRPNAWCGSSRASAKHRRTSHRASAGWLLEQTGFLPGTQVGPGVYCSQDRALTLTARDDATATSFTTALEVLAHAVLTTHRIRLQSEPAQPCRRSLSRHGARECASGIDHSQRSAERDVSDPDDTMPT